LNVQGKSRRELRRLVRTLKESLQTSPPPSKSEAVVIGRDIVTATERIALLEKMLGNWSSESK
jgi:hypothetical protein